MYYLIEITTKENDTEKAIYQYETRDEAIAMFHQKLGGAMKNADYLAEMLMVIDDCGAIQIYDYWQRPIESEEVEA